MTVAQLIERLREFDEDSEVCLAQPTHDHWRNIKAADVRKLDEIPVKFSSYHDALILADDEEEYDEGEIADNNLRVVLS